MKPEVSVDRRDVGINIAPMAVNRAFQYQSSGGIVLSLLVCDESHSEHSVGPSRGPGESVCRSPNAAVQLV